MGCPAFFVSGGEGGIRLISVHKAEVEAVDDNPAGRFIDENWQSVNDGEGDVIQGDVFDDAVAFHRSFCSQS